jgi:LuxR family maltose regulon positive regulatory protein
LDNTDTLIRTKLRLPFTRTGLVARPRLQEKFAQGLHGPLTLITAPAGFGKTILAASCVSRYGMPVAWLSLDKDDNQVERFLKYLVAAMQETFPTIGGEAAQLLAGSQQAPTGRILTGLINGLTDASKDIVLVLDDYQFISNQAVHEAVVFLLEHCPQTLHLVIVTRSDPPLPLARLRSRGQMVELRAADLRFSEMEAAQFLNEIMDLHLDARSVAVLEERTEGWITGLQMASIALQSQLSTRDSKDVERFIEGFSGTNRYILDYLLEEVLAGQSPEMQCFLLCTSILEHLTAPLCETILQVQQREGWIIDKLSTTFQSSRLLDCQSILEHLERSNLFLAPLDDERQWYRYHHLFADLLRARLGQIYPGLAPRLHGRAAAWYEQHGFILDAIQHASMAPDDEKVERLIEGHYMDMVNRGEMAWVRFWMGKLSKEAIHRRPWLCLYEALSRSWFGELEEANILLDEAEKRIRSDVSAPDYQSMLGYHAYVKSRVTAMQGDTRRAIELCLAARQNIPPDRLGLQNDVSITLGFEYFLSGDFENAEEELKETIRSGAPGRAINNPVAAYALLARMKIYQGRLHEADDLFHRAKKLIEETEGQYLGVTGLIEVETAALSCERNDLGEALAHIKRSLDFLPSWGKADDLCLAYIILWRIQRALGNPAEATGVIETAVQLVRTGGIFSEARKAVETTQVKTWLVQGDWSPVERWAMGIEKRLNSPDPILYEEELTQMTLARVWIAQKKFDEAMRLLSRLEESARAGGRQGRLIEIIVLKALALRAVSNIVSAKSALAESLGLAEAEGYARIFLDEGQPMHRLIAEWLAQASAGVMRDYAIRLLSQVSNEPQPGLATQGKVSTVDGLAEPLSPRELEVLQLIALGQTNREIARQLIVSPGTIKAHTASIYRKLEAANRTEAAARARQLGIIP